MHEMPIHVLDQLKAGFKDQLRVFRQELDHKQLAVLDAIQNNLGCVAIRNGAEKVAFDNLMEIMQKDYNVAQLIFTLAYFGFEDCLRSVLDEE
ncbi:hypothetical protein LCGC14_0140580 [marine sediment metagenome]|uniref:Uncharacterized protein n=1 Tax=marine sediment metagenome TaxID=412755 RepID=A0A0F9VG74_9ZZZZ